VPQLPPPADVRLVHGPHSPLVDIARICRRIARSDATVLLTGETGTGKEVFARLIHASSPRAARPLVPVNCGAIPETLLESELFGYVRGAFTGATSARRGRIAAAEGGTLFLDEIGELPLSLQVKLLRLLQERTYEPVGSAESVAADFRLVAATNRDLAAEVEAGRFRQDLYFRLLVCPVELPPLRERAGDVPHLFLHFWRKRRETRQVDPAVFAALEAWHWPGNIRELENLVERLSVCVEGPRICLEDLPPKLRGTIAVVRPEEAVAAPGGTAAEAHAVPEGCGAREARASPEAHAVPAPDAAAASPAAAQVHAAPVGGEAAAPRAAAGDPHAAAAPLAAGEAPEAHAALGAHAAPRASPPAAAAPAPAPLVGAAAAGEVPTAAAEPLACEPAGDPAVANDGAPAVELPVVPARLTLPIDLPRLLRDLENRFIEKALEVAGGNKRAAAELLGLQRTTLVEKLRRRQADASVA